MQQELTNKDLLRFLKNKHIRAGFIDSLKLHYRPLICPFISLINRVRPGDRVGDIGCGSGQFFLLLNEFAQASFFYGLEINKKLIKNGKELLSGLNQSKLLLELYDGMHFPSFLMEMDTVFLIDVLHHVPKNTQENFLRNLTRNIRSGATLVIKDIDAANPLVIFNKVHDLIVSRQISHELSCKKVREIIASTGMEIMDVQKITTYVYPHFTVAAKKP